MNELSTEDRYRMLNCLIEGMSLLATSRVTGAAKGTILRLIRTVGPACREFMNQNFIDLPCEHIEMDECWAFVKGKDLNLGNRHFAPQFEGSVWTWIATCRECKLIVDYAIGGRNVQTAMPFLRRLAERFSSRVQITTDAFQSYLLMILAAFEKGAVEYPQEIKEHGETNDETPGAEVFAVEDFLLAKGSEAARSDSRNEGGNHGEHVSRGENLPQHADYDARSSVCAGSDGSGVTSKEVNLR